MRPKQASRTPAMLRSLLAVIAAAILLTACGGSRPVQPAPSVTTHSKKSVTPFVDFYSGLPRGRGAFPASAAKAVRQGILLALDQLPHHQAGAFQVHYTALDDSPPRGGASDPLITAENARRVATDPHAVYYIGELGSAATEVALPVLNQAGIPEVSPDSPYIGLTRSVKNVTGSDGPSKYRPSGTPTLLELMPNEAVEADAVLDWLHQAQCVKVAAVTQTGTQDAGLVSLMQANASHYGVTMIVPTGWSGKLSSVATFAATLRAGQLPCFVFATPVSKAVVSLTKTLHADLPKAMIVGTDTLCNRGWTTAVPNLYCTRPTLELGKYPDAKQFVKDYKAAYHGNPNPYALYGYEAAQLGIYVIDELGPYGDDRQDVSRELFAIRDRDSVLGAYSFNKYGETTLRYYGLYQADASGTPVFFRELTP